MGNTCSSAGCVICWFMCLVFPIGTCKLCPDKHKTRAELDITSNEEAAKFNVDDLLKAYDDWVILHQPTEFCDQLYGNYHSDTSTCTVDLSQSDEFLKYVTGIDTPQQLCTQVDGNFANGNCTINVAQCGQAALDAKQMACMEHEGQWAGNNCALLM